MVKAALQLTLILLLLVILLTFEGVIGLPIVFLAVIGLLSSVFTSLLWWPLLLIIILSFVMASLYQVPIFLVFAALIGLMIFNQKGDFVISRRPIRVIAGAIIILALIILVSPISLVEIGLFTVLLQSCIVLLLIWRVIGIPIRRQ